MAKRGGTQPVTRSGTQAPARPKDARPTLVLKGDFTPELRSLINAAARKLGTTQSGFAVRVLTREAQRVLKGEALEETAQPPAMRQDEITAAFATMNENIQALSAVVAAGEVRLAELAEQRRRSPWERLREIFAPRR
jgi:uncharacterized protein (DUF1778 family)